MTHPAFRLEFSAAGQGVQIVSLGGAVALSEARELERGVVDGVGHGRRQVVVDLREVTDVGPGLLGVLLRIRRGITRVDGRLALVVAGPPVEDLVRKTLLSVLIDVTADREAAVALVSAPASRRQASSE